MGLGGQSAASFPVPDPGMFLTLAWSTLGGLPAGGGAPGG